MFMSMYSTLSLLNFVFNETHIWIIIIIKLAFHAMISHEQVDVFV